MSRTLRMLCIGLACLAGACRAGQTPEAAPAAAHAPAAAVPPDSAASAARGLAYAQRVCAACHAVEPGQRDSPNPQAPPFEVIANLPGMTAIALNAWLHSPHPSMPNVIVDPVSRDDIDAYLNSLRRGAGHG